MNGNMNCFTSGHLSVTLLVLFAFLISILMIPIVAAIATGRLSSISVSIFCPIVSCSETCNFILTYLDPNIL